MKLYEITDLETQGQSMVYHIINSSDYYFIDEIDDLVERYLNLFLRKYSTYKDINKAYKRTTQVINSQIHFFAQEAEERFQDDRLWDEDEDDNPRAGWHRAIEIRDAIVHELNNLVKMIKKNNH